MIVEKDHIPYQASACFPAEHILVLAPHADDEIFGCGGLLGLSAAQGIGMTLVILTGGSARGDDQATRLMESHAAAKCLSLPEALCWDLEDRGLVFGESLISRIEQCIRETGADLVLAPSPQEIHPDHFVTAQACIAATMRFGSDVRLAFYEIGAPLPNPSHLVDISVVREKKEAAMRCFVSQLIHQRYDQHISALNKYRSFTLPDGVEAAEAFVITDGEELRQGRWPFPDPLNPARARFSMFPALLDQRPLVTIMVRSLSRPFLAEALASIAHQTYSKIEIVLVNAFGTGHVPLPEYCGSFPLRIVADPLGAPVPRAQAANLALQAARGDYLMFLDDDDWIDREHVSRLLQAHERTGKFVAVFSDTLCVQEGDSSNSVMFASEYDASRLLVQNYLPIHSVLFSRAALLASGSRFDESIDLYEDWDFWIQLSCYGDFQRVPGCTAYYRMHQSSGVHAQCTWRHPEYQHIWQKWRGVVSASRSNALLNFVIEKTNDLNALQNQQATPEDDISTLVLQKEELAFRCQIADAEIFSLRNRIAAAEALVDQVRKHGLELEIGNQNLASEVAALRASTSWRITAPLRQLVQYFIKSRNGH